MTEWTTTTNNTVWAPYTTTTNTVPFTFNLGNPAIDTELRWAYEGMQAELERLEVGKKWMVLPAAPKRKLEMLPFWEEG